MNHPRLLVVCQRSSVGQEDGEEGRSAEGVFRLPLFATRQSGAPCGRNPISRFQPLTKMLGRDINSLLNLLRTSNPTLYQQVQDEWRRYADCVGLVDTGYFKRSMGQGPISQLLSQGRQGHGQRVEGGLPAGFGMATLGRSRRAERLLRWMRSAAAAGAGDGDGRRDLVGDVEHEEEV